MAQYFTDFSEYTTGAFPASGDDWTVRWTGASYQILSDAALAGGQGLEINSDAGAWPLISWDGKDGSNVEVLARISSDSGSGSRFQAATRAANSGDSRAGYGGRVRNAQNIAAIKWPASFGSASALAEDTTITLAPPYFVRFRANGDTLSVRAWEDGAGEPETWQIVAQDTDSSVPSTGWTGLSGEYTSGLTQVVDWVGIGTAGDTAPGNGVAVTGTATLDGSAISGATVIGVNDTQQQVDDVTTTDANGDYELQIAKGDTAHIKLQYEDPDTGEQYNGESKPFVVAEDTST